MSSRSDSQTALKPTFSTTDVARYCRVSGVQVTRWIKDGKLKCYRYPGGRYKITKGNFKEFLETNNIPIIEEFFESHERVRILIGEDDFDFADSLRQILEERYPEFQIEVVNDGYEALLKMGEFKPDLLILDIKMPKINGLEVCQRLKNNSTLRSIKILAITGNSRTYTREIVIDSGADEYLVKPFESEELFRNIEKLLGKKAVV